jgi:hypothetical protein
MLTDATARCIGEAPNVSGNSAGKERDAEFGNDYFNDSSSSHKCPRHGTSE